MMNDIMEIRRLQTKEGLEKLRQECLITKNLLDNLMAANTDHVNTINNLDDKEIGLFSEYYLAVSQFQHSCQQQLLEINMLLLERNLLSHSPNIENFQLHTYSPNDSNSPTSSGHVTPSILPGGGSFFNSHRKVQPVFEEPKRKTSKDHSNSISSSTMINKQTETSSDIKLNENLQTLAACSSTATQTYSISDVKSRRKPNDILVSESKTVPKKNKNDQKIKVSSNLDENKMKIERESETKTLQVSDNDSLDKVDDIEDNKKPVASPQAKKSIPDSESDSSSCPILETTSSSETEEITEKLIATKGTEAEKMLPANRNIVITNGSIPKKNDYCMIAWILSPSHFYIQVADKKWADLDELSEQLADYNFTTSCTCTTKIEALNKLGKFCSIQIDDDWYRVEVLDWMLDATDTKQDEVLIQLIDFGNIYKKSYTDLRPLPAHFHFPRMAQLCHLPYLYPPGSTKENILMDWSKNSIDELKIIRNTGHNFFKIMFARFCREKNSCEVDLLAKDSQTNTTVGQILLQKGAAVEILDDSLPFNGNFYKSVMKENYMMKQILTSQAMEKLTPNMSRDEVLNDYLENEDEEADTLNEAVLYYDPRDEAETCQNLRPDGTCYKGNRCKLRHKHLKNGYTTDREPSYVEAFTKLTLPNAGDDIVITITHIVDIQCFYAQLKYEHNGDVSPTITLDNIMNSSPVTSNYKKFKRLPAIGQLVVVKYWNERWYRGLTRNIENVASNLDDNVYEVFLVDYGEVIEVKVSDLRIITPNLLYIPFQAVECRLYNVKHNDNLDREVEKQYLESNYLSNVVNAHVVAVPGHLQVLLQNGRLEDIGLKLIEEGYGQLNTEHNFPSDNEIYYID